MIMLNCQIIYNIIFIEISTDGIHWHFIRAKVLVTGTYCYLI